MKPLTIFVFVCLAASLIAGCSAGDLRAVSDGLSQHNGRTVTYPDQRKIKYVADDRVRWVVGVKNGSGYQIVENESDDYCKVKVTYEDGSYDIFNLDPEESTGKRWVSIYNQVDRIQTISNTTRDVFNESFDDY